MGIGVVVALAVLAAGLGATGALLAADSESSGGGGGRSFDGTVYLLSNRSQPNSNSVLAYRYRSGALAPLDVREYPTGGAGAFDQANTGVLDSVDQIAIDRGRTELFAVNSSSDTIAAFHVSPDGTLTPVRGSPFASDGRGPASLAVRGRVLIVVNKAFDGVRKDLKSQPGSFASLPIRADGSLGAPISTITMSPGSAATQALSTPDGSLVIGSLESGQFVVFKLAADGSLTQAPGSPRLLDPARFAPRSKQGPFWPQGMAMVASRRLLYANVSNAAKLAVYSYDREGRLAFVDAVDNRGAKLPCWTTINAAGTRLYTDNAGNDTVSVFDIGSDPRRPRQLQNLRLRTSGNPWNLSLDASGRFLFVLNPRAVDFIDPGAGNTVHSLRVNGDGTLAELDDSPVAIPVSTDTQPQGLVAVARR
jgi:6-phosphogluconolactonase (cycloisomerase 2 family)